jgi:uncharacterized protein (DUF1697 family)
MPASTVYILLFRGVGGATQLPVARLRTTLEKAGFESVTTYINSGNAVLRSTLSREEVVARVTSVCKTHFGFEKAIFALPAKEWSAVIKRNPFPDVTDPPKWLHAAVLAARPAAGAVEELQAFATNGDRIAVVGKIAYLHTPNGFGTSKLAEKFDKGIGVANTARNWNTVLNLMKLVERAEGLCRPEGLPS